MSKDIVLDQYIIKKNRISLLIKDPEWMNLFKDSLTRAMKKDIKLLEEKFQQEQQAKIRFRKKMHEKKKLMEKILVLSSEVNNHERKELLVDLEDTKEKLLNINETMDEDQFLLETLPKEMDKINYDLLKETVKIAYKDIEEGNERIEYLTQEIAHLRDILRGHWEEKLNLDQRVQGLYEYLHNTLGYDQTNKLDGKFFEHKK